MLSTLIVQNYSILEALHMDFRSGFSVITGETGAGKSIMLGALGLLLGQRADSKTIHPGASKCMVEGHFSLDGMNLESFFQTNDLDYDPETCIIRREVYATGKSRAFVNDVPTGLAQLKELGEQLIDIHSQHKNLLLGRETFQLSILDVLAGNEELRTSYFQAFKTYEETTRQLQEALEANRKNKEEEDYLRFQYNQLEEMKLHEGEDEELEGECEVLSHAEDIKTSLYSGIDGLQESDENILSSIRKVQSAIRSTEKHYTPAGAWVERLENTYIELKDITAEIEDKIQDIEFDPARLDYVNERLDNIYSLEKKHGVSSVGELLELEKELEEKLNRISHSEEDIENLKAKQQQWQTELEKSAKALTVSRAKASKLLNKTLVDLLSRLGMENARFDVEIQSANRFRPCGKDEVHFLFNANKGGALQELSQVASGGEISRVMLALKAILAERTNLPTLIFDEIDTGVSGSMADKMGALMKGMCKREQIQVISITHLPQIAAQGNSHYKVYKDNQEDVTTSHMVELTPEERVEEIAHMLSGEHLTDAAIRNAKELLNR